MSKREQHRVHVLTQVQHGRLHAPAAAQLLGLSLRHLRRLLARLRQQGLGALTHGNRGRPSPRRLKEAIRSRVLTLARTTYAGFNDHHFTEMLVRHESLKLSRRTVQRLLRAAGLGSPRTRRPPRHRRRRERMPQAGLLVQMDGSHHPWLEDRGPRLVLLAAIDDATGRVVGAIFRLEEDTHGYLLLLRQLLRRYGIPGAIYTDRNSIFRAPTRMEPTLQEQLEGQRDHTQVGRALTELGIRWIAAQSPQAKGRIERLFGTFQDRLVAELRLARACTLTDAQRIVDRFLPRYNARFARRPADPTSAWQLVPDAATLESICCLKSRRTVANDNTVQVGDRLLHLRPGPSGRSYAQARVDVHTRLDGTLAVYYQGQRLTVRLGRRSARPTPPHTLRGRTPLPAPAIPKPPSAVAPPATHPWRRFGSFARRKEPQDPG